MAAIFFVQLNIGIEFASLCQYRVLTQTKRCDMMYLVDRNKQTLTKKLRGTKMTYRTAAEGMTEERIGNVLNGETTELQLQSMSLKSIPLRVWELDSLTRLDLYNNSLTSLSSNIWQLPNLKEIRLDKNKLTSIPWETGQLTNLEKFDMSRNELQTIPAAIGRLTNLIVLDLSDNPLASLPVEIGKLYGLQQLYLNRTYLKSLPIQVLELRNLKRVDLVDCSMIPTYDPIVKKLREKGVDVVHPW